MAAEFEIKVGRLENRTRYEECVSKIKKAFADYRIATKIDTDGCLRWSGKEYLLKEDGSFTRIDAKRDNINSLEADVAALVKYVSDPVKNAAKRNFGRSVACFSDMIDRELPEMSCAIARPAKDGLYWVTKVEYNGYSLEAFRQLAEAYTSFDMLYVIPLKYSSYNFEKDEHSGYMDSCEVRGWSEPKRDPNLESLFTRALSGIDYIGMTEGELDMEGVTVSISRKKNLIVSIVSGGAVVVLGADPGKSKVAYSCSYPSTENIAASLEGVMKALERLCELPHKDDIYMNCKIEEIDSPDIFDCLLPDIFR